MTAPEELLKDPELEALIRDNGEKKLEKADNPFERLVTSIINQQLSTQSAAAIRERFFESFTIKPENLVNPDKEKMAECGLSSQKIDYIKSAALRFMEDDLSPEKFDQMSDDEVIEELTEIHGVGVWTAKMFLITVLGREDVFPVEDLGIRRAMEETYSIDQKEDMRRKAEKWKPYRSLASLYLWESRD